MLDNHLWFHLFVNWTISAFASSRLAQNHLQIAYSLQGKQYFFWSHPRCFGPLDKFQHSIKISIKTAQVSSFDYALNKITIWSKYYFTHTKYAKKYLKNGMPIGLLSSFHFLTSRKTHVFAKNLMTFLRNFRIRIFSTYSVTANLNSG